MKFGGGAWMPDPQGGAGSRAQRALVRVLLALRCEARRSIDPSVDRARAEALADRIMLELPRSVLPIGIAALFIVGVVCLMPLMRDAVAENARAPIVPVASVVESGLREQGAALNDGFAALREVVAPFAAQDAPSHEPVGSTQHAPPAVAVAPFPRS